MLGLVLAAPASARVDPGLAEATRASNRLALDLKRPPCRVGVTCAAVLDVYGDVNAISHGLAGYARRRPCAHPLDQLRALRLEHARHRDFAVAVVGWGLDPAGRPAGLRAMVLYLAAASRVVRAC